MGRRIVYSLVCLLIGSFAVACGAVGVRHSDYGDCRRSVRHKHNDHVFLGDHHDHSLCEWSRFD